YASWQSFRESEDARYVALTLPHVLGRLPYGENFNKVDAFHFEEFVDGKDHDKYLWMNAAWAYAARITDAFAKYGWMARIRGGDPRSGGRRQGGGSAGAPLPNRRRRCRPELLDGNRPFRSPGSRTVQPRLPAVALQQERRWRRFHGGAIVPEA